MKIYFPQIVWQGKPLVWELSEDTHQASCLFYCLNEDYDANARKTLLNILKQISGINFNGDVAIIEDVRIFANKYALVIENSAKVQAPKLDMQKLKRKNSTFFDAPLETPRHTRQRSLTADTIRVQEHIDLDSLIPKDPEEPALWRDTVAYEKHFLDRNIKDVKKMNVAFLRSATSFNLLQQYENDALLFPKKSAVILAIRKLLDLLDPIYVDWCKQNTSFFNRNLLIKYFQDAVLDAMLNSRVNNKPTEFENVEQTKLNPTLRKHAIHKAQALRAELMLMKFLVLVDEDFPVELAVNEKTVTKLQPILTSLRQFILQQKPALINKLKKAVKEISACIIQSGVVEIANKESIAQLQAELGAKAPAIKGFGSFQWILGQILQGLKSELIPDILAQTTTETIKRISDRFNDNELSEYIAPLTEHQDQDFYLCPEWFNELTTALIPIKLKHAKNDKKIKVYSKAVADQVIEFFEGKLKEKVPSLSEASSSLKM